MTTHTFFTGCTHFDHENIIGLADRPFEDVLEMNEALIDAWNMKVRPQDIVYHLGDVAWSKGVEHLQRLNGRILIVPGNHDHPADLRRYDAAGFRVIDPIEDIMENNIHFVLCHYPIEDWNRRFRGSVHLHCHTHSKTLRNPAIPYVRNSSLIGHENDTGLELPGKYPPERKCNRFCVGVDSTDFAPISAEEIMEEMWKDD